MPHGWLDLDGVGVPLPSILDKQAHLNPLLPEKSDSFQQELQALHTKYLEVLDREYHFRAHCLMGHSHLDQKPKNLCFARLMA
jgi:hypothetical protein